MARMRERRKQRNGADQEAEKRLSLDVQIIVVVGRVRRARVGLFVVRRVVAIGLFDGRGGF